MPTNSRNPDLVIVGAGPAGLAAAIHAQRAGLSCVVLDKRSPPLEKACGEGIMPPGLRAIEALGVTLPPTHLTPLRGVRYLDGDVVADGQFASGLGAGVRRLALSEALRTRAQDLGIDVTFGAALEGFEQRDRGVEVHTTAGSFEPRYLVAADGLHSATRSRLGLQATSRGRPRYGLRRHYDVKPWSEWVEIHWSDGAEAYVTPVGNEVGIAMLYPGDGRSFDELLALFPALRDRLAGAHASSRDRGAGPLRQIVRRRYAGRVALLGDAAGYLDALTGEGITLAMHSASALVDAITRDDLRAYESAYTRLSRPYYWLTELLLWVGARPWLRRRVTRVLANNPEIFSRMLEINMGERRLRSIGAGTVVRILAGLL